MSPPRKFSQKKQAAAPHLDDRLMAIGYLTKAHGIRGEVVMVLQAESAEALQGEIYLRPRRGGVAKPVTLTVILRHHLNLLLSLYGVNTRDEAELLLSNTLLFTSIILPPLYAY